MRIRLTPRMEESSHLDGLLRDILKVANHVLRLPTTISTPARGSTVEHNNVLLIRPRHIPRAVYHLLVPWQELIEVLDAFGVLVKELRFARYGLASLDEVEDHDGGAIPSEKVVEVAGGGAIEGVDDVDWRCIGVWSRQDNRTDSLSIGGFAVMLLSSCVQ